MWCFCGVVCVWCVFLCVMCVFLCVCVCVCGVCVVVCASYVCVCKSSIRCEKTAENRQTPYSALPLVGGAVHRVRLMLKFPRFVFGNLHLNSTALTI